MGTGAQPVTNPPDFTTVGSPYPRLEHRSIMETLGEKLPRSQNLRLQCSDDLPSMQPVCARHVAKAAEGMRAEIQISAQGEKEKETGCEWGWVGEIGRAHV